MEAYIRPPIGFMLGSRRQTYAIETRTESYGTAEEHRDVHAPVKN